VAQAVSDAPALRAVGLVRVAVGAGTLLLRARPDLAVRTQLPRGVLGAARILAVRDLVQGTLLVVSPRSGRTRVGQAVDALHCASMLAVVPVAPRYRRAAAVSAVTAAAWLAATELAARIS
jgi:preprotein translocase subunit SecF